ncbi:hypothetical protein ABT224_29110 [Streptomyces sp. NPDC001584]|uniref:hypothetical protein n=1 Tax=Streptomyces sp. NPDC001584 TaxID=3154521 RepID=UPI00332AB79E
MMKRATSNTLKGLLSSGIFLAIPAIVLVEAISSTHDSYRPLAAAWMACPAVVCIVWRFHFTPGLRTEKEYLVVREPYRTVWIPWSEISELKWRKTPLGYHLYLVNRAAGSGGEFYPRAFQRVLGGKNARMQLLADMEAVRHAASGAPGGPMRQQRSSLAPEFASFIFFVLCLIVTLAGQ